MYKLFRKVIQKKAMIVIIILLLQTITTIISLIAPYINGKFVDILINSKKYNDIVIFTQIVFGINILGIMVGYIYKILQLKTKGTVSFDFNVKVIKHMQKIPIEKFEKFPATYLNQRIKGDCETIINFWFNNILSIIINILAIIIMSTLLFNANVSLFLIVLAFIPIYCAIYMLLRKSIYLKGRESRESNNMFISKLNEIYERNREIKTDGLFQYENICLTNSFNTYFGKLMKYNKLIFMFTSIDGVISLLFQILVFLFGGRLVIKGEMTIGSFTMISSYFNMIMDIIKYYFELGQAYQDMKISVNRLDELLQMEGEVNGRKEIEKIRKLSMVDANYTYKNCKVYKNNISLNFDKPGVYVLSGKNGIGKTTLINILSGINNLDLTGGVYINELEIKKIDMYNLRQNKISIMLQGYNRSDATVEEYIYKYLTYENIKKLKKNMLCNKIFFSELVNLDNLKNQKMSDLSSGERQMVQLFTKVYKEADLYIFDEPTSNVHPSLINYIWDLLDILQNLHKIVIVISHDSSINGRFYKFYNLDKFVSES